MLSWRERNDADRASDDPRVRRAALLEELAVVVGIDADNVGGDPWACPQRPPLSDEDRREHARLRALSFRLDYHATEIRAGLRGA